MPSLSSHRLGHPVGLCNELLCHLEKPGRQKLTQGVTVQKWELQDYPWHLLYWAAPSACLACSGAAPSALPAQQVALRARKAVAKTAEITAHPQSGLTAFSVVGSRFHQNTPPLQPAEASAPQVLEGGPRSCGQTAGVQRDVPVLSGPQAAAASLSSQPQQSQVFRNWIQSPYSES